MVAVAQLVRASDCDSEGHGFEAHLSPKANNVYGCIYQKMSLFEIKNIFGCVFYSKGHPR